MRQVDPAGGLDEDVDYVAETLWKKLTTAIDEREARELSYKMGGLGISGRRW